MLIFNYATAEWKMDNENQEEFENRFWHGGRVTDPDHCGYPTSITMEFWRIQRLISRNWKDIDSCILAVRRISRPFHWPQPQPRWEAAHNTASTDSSLGLGTIAQPQVKIRLQLGWVLLSANPSLLSLLSTLWTTPYHYTVQPTEKYHLLCPHKR